MVLELVVVSVMVGGLVVVVLMASAPNNYEQTAVMKLKVMY